MVVVWEQVGALCVTEGFGDRGLAWQRAPRLGGSGTERPARHSVNLAGTKKGKSVPRRGSPGRKSRSG